MDNAIVAELLFVKQDVGRGRDEKIERKVEEVR